MLVTAIVPITLALVFYTIGVWGQQIQPLLKPWHAVFFGLGLAADITGTVLMTRLPSAQGDDGASASGLVTLMSVSGIIAIVLMAINFVGATVLLIRNHEDERRVFHRFSIIVWVIWLIPYFAGAAVAMVGA